MTVWKVCSMEKCLRNSRPKRRITVQVIVDIILWFAVGVPNLYLFLAGVPYDRGFFCDDRSIQYPYKPDSISTPVLALLGLGASVAVVVVVEVLNCLGRQCRSNFQPSENLVYIIKCYAVFLVGFALEQMFTEVVKNATGVLRPNFMDVCRPKYNASLCPGYILDYSCIGTKSAESIRRSRQSFPSGHAAFSMYIAVYFCFYIHHRVQVTFSRILKLLLQMALLLASTVCGFRRIADHKHHMSDVIAGFFLGTFVAIFVYKTLAERIMTSPNQTTKEQFSDSEEQDPCCTCDSNISDPATPTRLLSAEYMTSNTNRHPLNGIQIKATTTTETSVES